MADRLNCFRPRPERSCRELFRQYLDRRLAAYAKMPDVAAAIGNWQRPTRCREPSRSGGRRLPGVAKPFDGAGSARVERDVRPGRDPHRGHSDASAGDHIPMLGALTLMSSMLAGYAMSGSRARSWIHMLGLAGVWRSAST